MDPRDLEYRLATAGDAPRVANLAVEGFRTYASFAPPGWSPPTLEHELAMVARVLALPSAWCQMALEQDGRLAGHVGWHAAADGLRPSAEPGLAHFWQLMIRRDWWGSGLAATLQAAGLEAAAERGFRAIRLFTPADHGRGRRFYEREGWSLSIDPFADELFGMPLIEYRCRLVARRKLVGMQEGEHRELMLAAIATEGQAHTALLAGDRDAARASYALAAQQYRESWALAPPKSYGRLVGLLKAAVLAGEAESAAKEVRFELDGDEDAEGSPVASYVLAVAAVILGDDDDVAVRAARMDPRGEAFERTATALRALAASDAGAYTAALAAIEADFAARTDHLTGVAIADTAVMLELIAAGRGLAVKPSSPLVPAL